MSNQSTITELNVPHSDSSLPITIIESVGVQRPVENPECTAGGEKKLLNNAEIWNRHSIVARGRAPTLACHTCCKRIFKMTEFVADQRRPPQNGNRKSV